ncbi:hypothetical protein [Methyloversatilis discipulorum]|uniref:hypothetical protein n=1 Tax=Methyloversatilis discipulorum TaxID=1119528 RepID=UPI0012F793B1|nr:hypothetical protein [Methyloversatilis discipulorum]
MVAVNAGKHVFKRRPHFRHPEGAVKDSCEVLAARALVLDRFRNEGLLTLPGRGRGQRISGLSGQTYDAWVEFPPERVKTHRFDIVDRAHAILTLDDGRRLRVRLTGRVRVSEDVGFNDPSDIPTLEILIDDPEIAALPPEELRKRIQLLIGAGVWCSHWQDASLLEKATQAAIDQANAHVDWVPDGLEIPDALSPLLKRESLLHLKAKEILERARRINLPELRVDVAKRGRSGKTESRSFSVPGQILELSSVQLERPMGRIRPDVVAFTVEAPLWPAGPVLIEITVTHGISDERLARIQAQDLPALEIDLSVLGGVVTQTQFEELLVEGLTGKRWLHHPQIEVERSRLEIEVNEALAKADSAAESRSISSQAGESPFGVSLAVWLNRYLDAILAHADAFLHYGRSGAPTKEALDDLARCAEGLALHGHSYAMELGRPNWTLVGLVEVILTIKLDRAIAREDASTWDVVQDLLQEDRAGARWQTLYLMALKVFRPNLTPEQQAWVDQRRAQVWASIKAGEGRFDRPWKFDPLLAELFPELAPLLSLRSAGQEGPVPRVQASTTKRHPGGQPDLLTDSFSPPPLENTWLTGKALEEWKRKNPDGVKNWEYAKQHITPDI